MLTLRKIYDMTITVLALHIIVMVLHTLFYTIYNPHSVLLEVDISLYTLNGLSVLNINID